MTSTPPDGYVEEANGWVRGNVVQEPLEGEVLVDVAAGQTVIPLTDAEVFGPLPAGLSAWVLVNGLAVTYRACDLDADTITLTDPLAAPGLEEGQKVQLWNPYTGKAHAQFAALVEFDVDDDGDSDLAPVKVSQAVADRLGSSQEHERGAYVKVQRSGGVGSEWRIVEVEGEELTVDLSYVDVDTAPPGLGGGGATGPTDPPASSPHLAVTGLSDAIVLTSEPLDAATTEVEYHMSLTEEFVPDYTAGTSTLLPGSPTRSLVFTVTSLPDGTPLAEGTTYYFRSVARNVVDVAPASVQSAGSLDPTRTESVILATLKAGDLTVGKLNVGPGYWSPDEGIVMPQSDGQITRLSAKAGVASQWAGKVIATFLTITAGILNGLLEVFGSIHLTRGVSAPRATAEVTDSWPNVKLTPTQAETPDLDGLCDSPAGEWVTCQQLDTGAAALIFFSKTTGQETSRVPLLGGGWTKVTRVGSTYFSLVTKTYSAGDKRSTIVALDGTGATLKQWDITTSSQEPITDVAAIGTDGTYVMAAWPTGGVNVRVRRYNTTTGALIDTVNVDQGSEEPIAGIARGEFDFGAGNTRIVLAAYSGADPKVYRTDATRDTAKEWPRAGGNRVRGLWWDGASFHTMNTVQTVYRYSGNATTVTRDIAYTWTSEDDTKETVLSPSLSATRLSRANLTVTVPPAPEQGQTGASKANRASVYARPAAGVWARQAVLAAGTNALVIDAFTTTGKTEPTTDGFAGVAAPGKITTAQGGYELLGDGTGAWPWLQPTGAITMFSGATAPAGWILCNGQQIDSVQYPALCAVLGSTFGPISGTLHYLPDFRSRYPIGVGIRALGDNETFDKVSTESTTTRDNRLKHEHTHTVSGQDPVSTGTAATGTGTNVTTRAQFNGHAHGGVTGLRGLNNLTTGGQYHPFLGVNFIIKT